MRAAKNSIRFSFRTNHVPHSRSRSVRLPQAVSTGRSEADLRSFGGGVSGQPFPGNRFGAAVSERRLATGRSTAKRPAAASARARAALRRSRSGGWGGTPDALRRGLRRGARRAVGRGRPVVVRDAAVRRVWGGRHRRWLHIRRRRVVRIVVAALFEHSQGVETQDERKCAQNEDGNLDHRLQQARSERPSQGRDARENEGSGGSASVRRNLGEGFTPHRRERFRAGKKRRTVSRQGRAGGEGSWGKGRDRAAGTGQQIRDSISGTAAREQQVGDGGCGGSSSDLDVDSLVRQ
jgi:hypothetical protein